MRERLGDLNDTHTPVSLYGSPQTLFKTRTQKREESNFKRIVLASLSASWASLFYFVLAITFSFPSLVLSGVGFAS